MEYINYILALGLVLIGVSFIFSLVIEDIAEYGMGIGLLIQLIFWPIKLAIWLLS